MAVTIENPEIRIVDDLKKRNQNNMDVIASEWYGNSFSYKEIFKMFDDYKKAFIELDGLNRSPITISSISTIASINSFYGAIDADKIINAVNPGFLSMYPAKYTTDLGSKTAVIYDAFLNKNLIKKLHEVGVKNIIITSITDYMNENVKKIAMEKGIIRGDDFLDEYIKSGNELPKGMEFIRMSEFARMGSEIKKDIKFPYKKDQIAAYFLTGGTTSKIPKGVKLYCDGFTKMAKIYDKMWWSFKTGDRQLVFIPLFYATGAVHAVYAGLVNGMTLCFQPKYDKLTFANDLIEKHANIALATPSHVSILNESNLKDNELDFVKYVYVGGEAVMPAQMKTFREIAKRLGIGKVINGYGMTETGGMTGVSAENPNCKEDVKVYPIPGVKYRIVDVDTGKTLSDNQRGILHVSSPCKSAGYLEEERNTNLFTTDNWINTGDIAMKYSNGGYRVFGRASDFFINDNKRYYMFDIEEKVLEHPGISEAEVIKFKINEQEYPAIVVVLNEEWEDKKLEVLNYINNIDLESMKYILGTKFISRFKTNPITGKRDQLALLEDKYGYYRKNKNSYLQTDIKDEISIYPVLPSEIVITDSEGLVHTYKK